MKEKTNAKEMQKLIQNAKVIKKLKKQVKGITLIALVVTIIVLLILAGIAISLTVGNNGIFTRARTAVIVNENASVYEQLQLIVADYQMDNIETGNDTAILERLKADGYVNEVEEAKILNVTNLMERTMQTGNGTIETGDVYVLEQRQITASSVTTDTTENMDYYLIYYGKNNSTSTNLGLAFVGNIKDSLETTGEEWFEFDDETGAIALMDSRNYYNVASGILERELGLEEIIVPETYNGKRVTKMGIVFPISNGVTLGINTKDVKRIVLPDSIEIINDGGTNNIIFTGAFANCVALQSIELSENLKSIGMYAFYNCVSIEEIVIPKYVKEIKSEVFGNCINLKKIDLPNSLTTIGNRTFYNCTSLEEITIPMFVKSVGENIFENCNNLKKVIIQSKEITKEDLGVNDSVEVIYDDTEYFNKANYLLQNKTAEQLENYILWTGTNYKNFEEWLNNEKGMTREELKQQANLEGMSYEECLKEIIINEENNWIYVEIWYENSRYSKMSISGQENELANKLGYNNFEDLLKQQFGGRQEFNQYLQSINLEETDLLKYILYISEMNS